MRNRVMTVTAALLLASATSYGAGRKTPPSQAPAATRRRPPGIDRLRLPRHLDRRRRGALRALPRHARRRVHEHRVRQGNRHYLFDVTAKNIGYRDQNYSSTTRSKRVKFGFLFDSIPLNYCYNCSTPWVESSRQRATLDADARQQVQRSRYPGRAAAAGRVAAAAPAGASVYRGLAKPVRHPAAPRHEPGSTCALRRDRQTSHFTGGFTSTHKSRQPAVRHVVRVQQRERAADARSTTATNDLSVGVEWASRRACSARLRLLGVRPVQPESCGTTRSRRWTTTTACCRPGPVRSERLQQRQRPGARAGSRCPDNTMSSSASWGSTRCRRRTTLNGTIQIIDRARTTT